MARDEYGKLPYDVQLRAPEERRRSLLSFVGAAVESFRSGSSLASKPLGTHFSKSSETRSLVGDDGSRHSSDFVGETKDQEV